MSYEHMSPEPIV